MIFDTTTVINSSEEFLYNLANLLLANGWTSGGSGDGLSAVSTTTFLFTGFGSGANNLGNTRAWFGLTDPYGYCTIYWQRGTSASAWRVSFVNASGLSVGATANTSPTPGASEVVLTGGGTNTAPTYNGNYFSPGASIAGAKMTVAIDNAGPNPGSFYAFPRLAVSGANAGLIGLDVMQPGSTLPSDACPIVPFLQQASSTYFPWVTNYGTAGTSPAIGYYGTSSTANARQLGIPELRVAGLVLPNTNMVDPWNSKDILICPPWVRAGNVPPIGAYKGYSTLFRYASFNRGNWATGTVSTTRDKVYLNSLWLPWDGTVPTF